MASDAKTAVARRRKRLRRLAGLAALGGLVAAYVLSATTTLLVGSRESFMSPTAPAECLAWRPWYVASFALPLVALGLFVGSFFVRGDS